MEEDANPGRKRTIFIIVIGVLVVLAGAGYFLVSRKGNLTEQNLGVIPSVGPTDFPTANPLPSETPEPSLTLTPTPKPKPTATPVPPTHTPVPPTPTLAQQSTTVNSTTGLDGFRSSNNGGNDTLEIRVGRNSNLTTRGFVSFNIPSAIVGKTIDSATLRLYQYQITGSPYTIGGNILIEHMDYGYSLDSADYAVSPFDGASTTISASNPTLEWKDSDVVTAVKNDLTAGHSRAQFRLKSTTETIGGDTNGDFAYFYSSNSGSNTNPPQLVIKYH